MASSHPEWHAPSADGQSDNRPSLINSFTKTKTPFVPITESHVSWYICGPTVYDSAHMGHARNYLNFDVLRRIMTKYFGYNVMYVMNVTDVDDKIILRANTNRLAEVIAAVGTQQSLPGPVQEALAQAQGLKDSKDLPAIKAAIDGLTNAARAAWGGAESLKSNPALACLAEDFDIQTAYLKLARHFEDEFFADMRDLGMQAPDTVTRVSEYFPQIVDMISGIVNKGYAYAVEGSVYFDVGQFGKADCHHYGKLVPTAVGNAELLAEGEGSLSGAVAGKRSPSDFALWKKSKPGEPQWPSPWGMGRPGWHIECSAMCSDVLGKNVDINCGGVDLAFPHHDNQLAQSEAYWDCKQWVNYFLHTGHLHIEGMKMSKSLKNFITIRKALEMYTARQIRFLFLLHHWNEPMDLTPKFGQGDKAEVVVAFQQMEQAVSIETRFKDFFQAAKGFLRGAEADTGSNFWREEEKALNNTLHSVSARVRAAMLDSFDTPAVIKALQDLVSDVNKYMEQPEPRAPLVRSTAAFVTRILDCMGVTDADANAVGFGGSAGGTKDEIVRPYLDALTAFRDELRALARSKAEPLEILRACDRLRDDVLPPLGVQLDDKADGRAMWKLEDPAVLAKAKAREAEEKAMKEEAKRKLAEDRARKAAEKERLDSIPPLEFFKQGEHAGQFTKYDANGLPTHDNEGAELPKSRVKKLEKTLSAQVKAHDAWKKKQGAAMTEST
eukprot:CAMPEP_0114544762 /NCGR_PEP_ID=MMETSP0114-20121206/3046_1 /TAXON_ID=31324 /ORGANISM="Goniomonas sp, Strain m" /LENGTH=723 /DNA_ID=CAMNT_0001729157 /DNA_START=19 /DNA_END=2190 /DNA_ORIENTATION=-